jgi:hypothetical protein
MAICGCGSPARCCQPAVAGGIIYADLRVSLTLTWPCRFCLLRVLLCVSHCYKLSSFQPHWGRWHCTCFLRLVCSFTVHMGSWLSPLSCGVLLPLTLLQAFLLLIAGRVLPLLPSPAQLVYLQFREGFPSPPLQCSGHPTLFAMCLFFCYCLLFSFLFPGWGLVCAGAMLIWPRIVCGNTAYCLAHLVVCVFPSHLGSGNWRPRGPPGFSI